MSAEQRQAAMEAAQRWVPLIQCFLLDLDWRGFAGPNLQRGIRRWRGSESVGSWRRPAGRTRPASSRRPSSGWWTAGSSPSKKVRKWENLPQKKCEKIRKSPGKPTECTADKRGPLRKERREFSGQITPRILATKKLLQKWQSLTFDKKWRIAWERWGLRGACDSVALADILLHRSSSLLPCTRTYFPRRKTEILDLQPYRRNSETLNWCLLSNIFLLLNLATRSWTLLGKGCFEVKDHIHKFVADICGKHLNSLCQLYSISIFPSYAMMGDRAIFLAEKWVNRAHKSISKYICFFCGKVDYYTYLCHF